MRLDRLPIPLWRLLPDDLRREPGLGRVLLHRGLELGRSCWRGCGCGGGGGREDAPALCDALHPYGGAAAVVDERDDEQGDCVAEHCVGKESMVSRDP